VNNITTNIVRQSKYFKSFKQNYDDKLGLLTKNGSPFYYICNDSKIFNPRKRIKLLPVKIATIEQIKSEDNAIIPQQRGHSILYYFFLAYSRCHFHFAKDSSAAVIVIPCSFFY